MSERFLNISAGLLQEGYSIEFRATGSSMYPTIKDGEMITVQPVEISNIKTGDIVLYRNRTGVIAHRVIYVKGTDQLLLCGDSSNSFDAPVMPEQILGKVTSIKRGGRKILLDKKASNTVRVIRAWLIQALAILIVSFSAFAGTPTIDSIRVSSDKNSYNIYMKGEGDLDYTAEFLNDPPRIVLQFVNAKNNFQTEDFRLEENPFVSQIHSSEEAKDGQKFSRFTFDLKSPMEYVVAPDREGLVIHLSPKSPTAITQSASIPSDIDIHIGAEDLLEITVFELPQFNVTSRVSGDGSVTMPLVGSVEVGGLTKKEAEKKIAAALETKYVNNASVSINIKEYKSKQVSILGAVKNPGAYYILSNRTLLQLLSDAGGLTPQAGSKCFVFRSGSPKIEVDLNELMNSGNEKFNIPVMPGDVINVPLETKVIVYVLGAVRSPGAIEMTTTLPVTLLAAIARAGGLTDEANKSNIQIRRKDDKGADTVIKVNLKDILNGKIADVPLNPGDAINISESFF
jgi:polysaccharide export outer membrane protein